MRNCINFCTLLRVLSQHLLFIYSCFALWGLDKQFSLSNWLGVFGWRSLVWNVTTACQVHFVYSVFISCFSLLTYFCLSYFFFLNLSIQLKCYHQVYFIFNIFSVMDITQTTISPHTTLSVGKHMYSSSGRVDTMNFTWRGSCLGNQVNFRAPSRGESWSSESSRITKGCSFVALDKKTGNWSNTPLVDWKRHKMKINTICTWI